MAEGLEKFTQRFFRSREAAQEQAELLRLLEEMREVQEKLLRFMEGASPLSEAELRSQFYRWYEEFVKEPIRPGSELWRPVEELVERYNWYVRQFGRGVELPLGAGMKELRRAAEELSHELYAAKLSTREVGELFTRRAELTRQLYEMATSSTKVRRALKSIGLIPVTWSTEELFARAAEGFLDEENFFAYFAFHTRRGKTEALLARYFPYDFPRYPEFIRRLERAQPGLGEAWVQRYAPAERIAIRGYRYGSLARFEPRLALVRTGSGGLEPRWIEAPREIRDIFQETAPEVEVGVPPTAPTSPTSLKAVVRQGRAGFYVREALAELEERKYFSRYFPRGASEIDRLRVRLLKAREPDADIARVLDYVGRELVELRTGARWRVESQAGEMVRLVPVFDDPRRLRFAWKHQVLQDLLEAVEESYAPSPSAMPIPAAAAAPLPDAVKRVADELLRISSGELAYTAARYPGIEAALYGPVKRAIQRMPYYRYLFEGAAYALPRGVEPEDIVQDLNLYLMEYARQWVAERNITQVTREVRREFLEDWYRAASRRVREFLFQMRAQARGIPEEEFRRALGILSRLAPGEELSAADIAHLRSRFLQELELPTEREAVVGLLDVAAEELEELSRLTRAAYAEPLSLNIPIRPRGKELEEGMAELLDLLGEPKETVGERIVSRLPTPEEAVIGREPVPLDEAARLRKVYARYRGLLEEYASLAQKAELTKREARRKAAIERAIERLEARYVPFLTPETLGVPLPETIAEGERVARIARVLMSRPELAVVTTVEGYPVELLGVRGGISEWRIKAGPEAGRVLRIGAGGTPLEIKPEDIPSLFTWGGYTGAFGKYTLPLTTRLDAPTLYFRSRAQGILGALETLSELREGQRVVVFDIETTTLPELAARAGRPELFGITEIAARRYLVRGGRLVPEVPTFRRFVRPSAALEAFLVEAEAKRAAGQQLSRFEQEIVENVTRLGLERLRRGVLTPERALTAFQRYVKDVDVILGQGIGGFDIPLLARYGVAFEGKRVLDLQALAAYLGETRTALEYLVERYAPERIKRLYAAGAHEAGVDVRVTAAVFSEMAQQARERYAQESFVRIGDYVVRHTAYGDEAYRGVYRILGFEPERNVLELLRVDTGELATLAAPTRAELEHLFYSQFYHLGPEYRPEIDLRYAQDRAARMVRRALERLEAASYYREHFGALEAYAAAAGLPLEEVRVLEPAVYRRLPEEQWRMLAAMRTSELRAYQQAYHWWAEEFERVHAPYLEELTRAAELRLITEKEAAERWKSYTAYLSRRFPFQTIERAAEPFEQRLELELAGQRLLLRTGARQWAESSLRRALAQHVQALGVEGEAAEAAQLSFLRAELVPALRRLGVQVAVPEAEELGVAVQEVAASLARHRVPTVRYEDVLTPRTSELFVRAAEEARRRLAGEAAEQVVRPDRAAEFLQRLGELELAPLARTAERYSMAKAWGLEAVRAEVRRLLEHPQVRKLLPAALALPLAYLGFQLLRNDPIDLGPHTPQPVRGPAPYEWTLAPDMRLYAPQASIGFDVKISATDRQGVAGQELAAHVHQGVQQALGAPLEVSLIMRDNTNQLSLDWWQRQIADALAY